MYLDALKQGMSTGSHYEFMDRLLVHLPVISYSPLFYMAGRVFAIQIMESDESAFIAGLLSLQGVRFLPFTEESRLSLLGPDTPDHFRSFVAKTSDHDLHFFMTTHHLVKKSGSCDDQ